MSTFVELMRVLVMYEAALNPASLPVGTDSTISQRYSPYRVKVNAGTNQKSETVCITGIPLHQNSGTVDTYVLSTYQCITLPKVRESASSKNSGAGVFEAKNCWLALAASDCFLSLAATPLLHRILRYPPLGKASSAQLENAHRHGWS